MLDESIKEYLVQITIIEGRHLVAKDDNGLSNPFVKIRIGKSAVQSTEVIMECLTPVWNQSFTFSNLMLSDQEFQTGELMVEMFSKNRFFGNSLIGNYSIGLSTLYKNANHEYFNVWLSLSNPEFPEEVQGYLLVDCFIIRAGDRPPVHSINDKFNQDVGEDDEELNLDNMKFDELKAYQEKQQGIIVLGKPSIAQKGFQLSCFIFKVEGLCKFPGTFGYEKPSAFISIRTVGLVKTTKTISNNCNPVYNQKILFPSYLPFLNDKIVMRIWNRNSRAADDFIANIPEFTGPNDVFNISKLLSMGGRMAAVWVNMYCIPPWERNIGFSLQKKKHPKLGTYFMGRVLLAFFLLPNPTPYFGVLPCNMMSDPPSQSYRLFADIYEMKYLKNYEILVWCDVNIGGYDTSNKKQKVKNDGAVWKNSSDKNEVSLQQIMQNFPVDIQQLPDIIISLYTGADVNDKKRLGFIRLKAEDVSKYDHTPRWLHFNPIDLSYDSPGSILINLQLVVESSNVKRVLKEKGLDKKFILYAHIIQGFDLDPTNKRKTQNEYCIEVFMDSNCISGKSGITKNTKKIPDAKDKKIKGDFPFYNEVVMIDTDLDLKLDFAPDVVVKLKKRDNEDEEIGIFTVPIRSIRKKNENDYPHYFNFIKNNQIVGRLLAMFYIASAPARKNADAGELEKGKNFKLYEKLKVKKKATIKIFVHGIRDMDFTASYKKCKLGIKILSNFADAENDNQKLINHGTDSTSKGNNTNLPNSNIHSDNKSECYLASYSNYIEIDEKSLGDLNNDENTNFINICKLFEFTTYVYGDPKGLDTNDDDDANLTIFPMIEFKLINSGFFTDTERFIIMNLSEFCPGFSERTKLKYQKIFEDNLSKRTIDQEQKLINMKSATGNAGKKSENELFPKRNDDDDEITEEERLLYKNEDGIQFKEKKVENKNQAAAPLIKTVTQQEINDFITKYEKFDFHKFLDITTEDVICLKDDKDKERGAKRKLIKSIKLQLDALRRKEDLTPQEVEDLIKYQDQVRELKKPLMSENMFYGFEDVSDDYDYGTEIYKDDIYEFHPNMQIPYKERNMLYIPFGLFEEKCHDIGGYMKLGKESTTKLKFNIQVTIHEEDSLRSSNSTNEINLITNKNSKKNKIIEKRNELVIIKDEKETEDYIKKQLEAINEFNITYVKKLEKVFYTKDKKKRENKDLLAFPISGLRVRVYIFRCLNLTAQENNNSIVDNLAGYSAYCKANSFIELKLGDNANAGEERGVKYINDVSSLIENTLNPNFFKFYELEADLPQDRRLEIAIKSKGTSSDSLIGSTIIDLENRYLGEALCREILQIKSLEDDYLTMFNSDQDMQEDRKAELNKRISMLQVRLKDLQDTKVPVEFRPLYKPNTMTAQGIIEMLVEVLPVKIAKIKKPLKIEPPPAQEYELRLIIWETRNVFVLGKKTLDLYIKVAYDPEGWLSEPTIKETDTHLGCSSGRGIYNWRMKFPIKIPCTFPRLNFRVYDFNTLSSDDAIGECYISLKRVFKKLMQQGELTLDKKWIPLAKKNDSGDIEGEILISIYFVPQDLANQNSVGEAQDEPNRDPVLERPKEGRGVSDFLSGTFLDISSWSFNFDLFGNLKLLAILGTVLTVFVVLFISPGILTQ